MKGVVHSAIYRGVVRHRRHGSPQRTFAYRLWFAYLDLDELDAVFEGRWLWSRERTNVVSFRRADFLGPHSLPLRDAVRARVWAELRRTPVGPVRMLTVPRCLGIAFNPVTFYYCFAADGVTLDAVVAEITNTPWQERHAYVLDARGSPGTVRARFAKQFHVSPFLGMEQTYEWFLSPPGQRLAVHMKNRADGEVVHEATLALRREPWTKGSLARALLRHPFLTGKFLAAIYWQALRLWLCRAHFHPHPKLATQESIP